LQLIEIQTVRWSENKGPDGGGSEKLTAKLK